MSNSHDIHVVRELAKQYAAVAANPVQEERRRLWSSHNSLKPTRPPVLATYGMWNVWCREVFGDHAMKCTDPFYRDHERVLRMKLFQDTVGDDSILEPWTDQRAAVKGEWGCLWGVRPGHIPSGVVGGAWRFDPPIKDLSDISMLTPPPHIIDEEATKRNVERLQEAVGGILEVNIMRGPVCQSFMADISYDVTRLVGLEQLMIAMYESPRELHKLLAFLRDGILANQQAAEKAGDWGLTDQHNQSMTYADGLPRPKPNTNGRGMRELWGHAAAQEYTLISPAMHDEFLLQYQLPILKQFGLTAYGCCEDLTHKIDMLRQVPNLRHIMVAPRADVRRCAEQIGRDYVLSWRPNPADMVCCGFDEGRIRRIIRDGLAASKGCIVHVHLKDIETVEGDLTRLARWVRIVRDVAEETAA